MIFNPRVFTALLVAALVMLAPACCFSSTAANNVSTEAAVHDRYATLIEATLAGNPDNLEGVAPISDEDLRATPWSVRALLANTIKAVYASRGSWHALNFNVNDGPDPATLELAPPDLPFMRDADVAPITSDAGR